MIKILIVNGPNLDMLGKREPDIYGAESLADITRSVTEYCRMLGAVPQFFQSNSEGELVSKLHSAMDGYDGVIINAGAYTHYSYAIADALAMLPCPKIEVHMSNVFAREQFRHTSVLSPVCSGVICGFGADVYRLAVTELASLAKKENR